MQKTITKKFLEEDKWAMEHYKDLQEEYPDEWVIIKGNQVTQHGKDIEQISDDYCIFISSGADIL